MYVCHSYIAKKQILGMFGLIFFHDKYNSFELIFIMAKNLIFDK